MKTFLLILAMMIAVGCNQDFHMSLDPPMPKVGTSPIKPPVGRAEVLQPGIWDTPEGAARLRTSVCDLHYDLQIKRISTHQGNVVLRVNTKDGDDYGWSAVMTQIPFHTIPTTAWSTVLLFDEDDVEICFNSTDNVAFVQGLFFDEDVEFEVRFYNVSSSIATTPETVLWPEPDRVYYTLYPEASGDCSNLNPSYCDDFNMEADIVGSNLQEGAMQFGYLWDATTYSFTVPPPGSNSHNATYNGPIIIRWWAEDHVNTSGEGYLIFDCDNSQYFFEIGNADDVHGVLIDPDGRRCKLTY
jgi:hypothetical protein